MRRAHAHAVADADLLLRRERHVLVREEPHLRTVDRPWPKPEKGESVEAWARAVRLFYGLDVRREVGAERIAEGHTLDDQAETLLIALVRGGGLEALGGIAPILGPEVQPLIDVRHDDVEAFCRALRLRPRRDPTNRDTKLLRNAVRLKVIPAIEGASGRDVKGTFARAADLIRRDERELSTFANRSWEDIVEETAEGFEMDVTGLLALRPAIGSRVVRETLYRAKAIWLAEGRAANGICREV